tara:strand:+ start:409 stop:624 length:216 start_codon:yes stop_codon:yes gene_type:complete
MEQDEILEYIKDEIDFAHELWQDLEESRKTESFKNYLKTQITSTIFAQQAPVEILNSALQHFEIKNFETTI